MQRVATERNDTAVVQQQLSHERDVVRQQSGGQAHQCSGLSWKARDRGNQVGDSRLAFAKARQPPHEAEGLLAFAKARQPPHEAEGHTLQARTELSQLFTPLLAVMLICFDERGETKERDS